jgi:phosphohistidine phosphatase
MGMKTLFLVRHAKSSWDDPSLPDEDRPLNARGRRAAPKMGKRLAKRGVRLDLILSSPAKRAIKTAQALADRLDYKLKKIVVDDRLYPGSVSDLLEFVHNLSKKLNRVMLVGHHPALSKLAQRLSSDIMHMPTCAVAEFRFKAKLWRDVSKATVSTVGLDFPKKP